MICAFDLNSHSTADIDECLNGNAGCTQDCMNKNGSFSCSCRAGFFLKGDGRTCGDINECSLEQVCQHSCINNHGSFSCECNSGYTLNADRTTCSGKENWKFSSKLGENEGEKTTTTKQIA